MNIIDCRERERESLDPRRVGKFEGTYKMKFKKWCYAQSREVCKFPLKLYNPQKLCLQTDRLTNHICLVKMVSSAECIVYLAREWLSVSNVH